MTNSPYEGPEIIGYAQWPGRGTTYHFKLAGQDVELYITEKRKKLRVFIDHTEWTARRTTPPRSTRERESRRDLVPRTCSTSTLTSPRWLVR